MSSEGRLSTSRETGEVVFGPHCGPYNHNPHYADQGGTPGASVWKGDRKLIRFFEDGHEELYNLRMNPGETVNLASVEPEKWKVLSRPLTE